MQAKSNDIARGEMWQTLSKMEVRSFVRIQVIWDYLLASKAELIQKQALFLFPCSAPIAVNNYRFVMLSALFFSFVLYILPPGRGQTARLKSVIGMS